MSSLNPPRYVVGLDFGTYASGPAYFIRPNYSNADSDPVVHEFDQWPDQPEPYSKNRSAILYDGSQVVTWGWSAIREYEKRVKDNGNRCPSQLLLVKDIKLLLFNSSNGECDWIKKPTIPSSKDVTQVIADYLREMMRFVLDRMKSDFSSGFTPRSSTLSANDVKWCLTVPAIWSPSQKNEMRKAAYLAGLIQSRESDKLLIVLEPEAAAVAALHNTIPLPIESFDRLRLSPAGPTLSGFSGTTRTVHQNTPPKLLRNGDVLLVVDCGGGTVDVTLHRVMEKGGQLHLQEASVGSGGPWGSEALDRRFEKWIQDQIGSYEWDKWIQNPCNHLEFRKMWEEHKRHLNRVTKQKLEGQDSRSDAESAGSGKKGRGWTNNIDSDTGSCSNLILENRNGLRALSLCDSEMIYEIPVPDTLIPIFRSKNVSHNAMCTTTVHSSWRATWKINVPVFLDPIMSEIKRIIDDVLKGAKNNGVTCNKALLVGGFSASRYLQTEVVRHLNSKNAGIRISIPNRPDNAVLKGAVYMGCRPKAISARRSRYCYGTDVALQWNEKHAEHRKRHGYPEIIDGLFSQYAKDCFHIFVRRNELVDVDSEVQHTFYPMHLHQAAVRFSVLKSESNEVEYVEDPNVTTIATTRMNLPNNWSSRTGGDLIEILAKMKFGASEIFFTAEEALDHKKVETNVTFSSETC